VLAVPRVGHQLDAVTLSVLLHLQKRFGRWLVEPLPVADRQELETEPHTAAVADYVADCHGKITQQ
jgi:hypothetical protein